MNWITITGVQPWDGRYPFDIDDDELTTREWGWIKRLAGYLPVTIGDGFAGSDPELYSTFAVIALYRAGRIQPAEAATVFERIADAPFGTAITIEADPVSDEQAADAGPPDGKQSSPEPTSGLASTTSSETSPSGPNGSGIPASDTSGWPPVKWAS